MADNSQTTACCSEFLRAQESGSDNEGYGRLISCANGLWQIGDGLPPLAYCPWCGKDLEEQHGQ